MFWLNNMIQLFFVFFLLVQFISIFVRECAILYSSNLPKKNFKILITKLTINYSFSFIDAFSCSSSLAECVLKTTHKYADEMSAIDKTQCNMRINRRVPWYRREFSESTKHIVSVGFILLFLFEGELLEGATILSWDFDKKKKKNNHRVMKTGEQRLCWCFCLLF